MIDLTAFEIDGRTYPNIHVMSLKRSFKILDGQNVGRTKQGAMIRDIVGTYYNYTLELLCAAMHWTEYDEFYQLISAPKDFHTIIMPYNQGTITFDAYINSGDDEVVLKTQEYTRWKGLTVNFVAKLPYRKPA